MKSEKKPGLTVAGLAVISVIAAAGIVTETLPLAGAIAAFLITAFMIMGYAAETTALLFLVQVGFTTVFLSSMRVYAGPLAVTPDTALMLWVFMLWFFALADGEGGYRRTFSGAVIKLLMILSVIAFIRGLAGGYEPETVILFLKSMAGYLFFFPCMWLLRKQRNIKLLTAAFAAASLIAGLWVIAKGFVGGEGVYVRATTGLRVTSREINVTMLGLFLVGIALWKKENKVPVLPGAAAVLIMGASLLLGQSRALWVAVATGFMISFIADFSRTGFRGGRLAPMVSRILLVAVFAAGSIAFVSAAGLLSAADVAARSGTADGGFAGDVSLWARFLSWWEILRTLQSSPFTMLLGTGYGYEIMYFRPDLLSVVSIPYVDGSFFQILLNSGLLGMVLLALLYARGIADSFRLVLSSVSKTVILLALWLTASFTALTVAALSSSLITNYRFSCLWAFLFALMETLKEKEPSKG
ncbi:hypothetical protein CSA37_01675 [Candidatus Fermentibacteria bacterium]|nr:MAG: hypothetical protein CSA37_01675 [Candidatus Fermentibacteria bacterium]